MPGKTPYASTGSLGACLPSLVETEREFLKSVQISLFHENQRSHLLSHLSLTAVTYRLESATGFQA